MATSQRARTAMTAFAKSWRRENRARRGGRRVGCNCTLGDLRRNPIAPDIMNTPPDEDFQAILLSFIDAATPWHLRVLGFYHDPESHLQERGIKLTSGDYLGGYVSRAFPDLEGRDAFRLQIERDLLHYGLIYAECDWYER